jgi:hypothetical protein
LKKEIELIDIELSDDEEEGDDDDDDEDDEDDDNNNNKVSNKKSSTNSNSDNDSSKDVVVNITANSTQPANITTPEMLIKIQNKEINQRNKDSKEERVNVIRLLVNAVLDGEYKYIYVCTYKLFYIYASLCV